MKSVTALSLSAAAAVAALSLPSAAAFSATPAKAPARRRAAVPSSRRLQSNAASLDDESCAYESTSLRRRHLLRLPLLVPLAALSQPPAGPAHAVVVENKSSGVFKVGATLSPEEAEARLRLGRKSVQNLLDKYDEVCDGGGDNVRRYLGTVGTSSGLYGISKVMKVLSDRADDIVDYTELMNEVEANIQQADGSAYMAIFVTSSTSQDRPEKYFKDALVEIKRLAKNIDAIAAMAGVDLDG